MEFKGLIRLFSDFMRSLEEIEQTMVADSKFVGETRQSLMKLIGRMDALESSFDRIAERSRK